MNNLQRIELRDETKSRLLLAQNAKKVAIGLLAGLVSSVMVAWFIFLGWGLVAVFHWLLKIS